MSTAPYLRVTKQLAKLALAILTTLGAAGTALASIHFDQLDACDGIAAIFAMLHASPAPICRPPATALERALVQRTGSPAPSELCLLKTSPSPALAGYSCFLSRIKKRGSLSCFRTASMDDIKEYKRNYPDKYGDTVVNYLKSAKKCPVSKDAAIAIDSQFSFLLRLIARHEFGYVSTLLWQGAADGAMIHGYASVDPALQAAGAEAIEYTEIYMSGTPSAAKEWTPLGKWQVSTEDGGDFDRDMQKELRKRGLPIFVQSVQFTLRKKKVGEAASQMQKIALLEKWGGLFQTALEQSGFEVWEMEDVERVGKVEPGYLRKRLIEQLPFHLRDTTIKLMEKFIIMRTLHAPPCVGRNGQLLAMVFSYEPVPDVAIDHGSINVRFFGLGNCGSKEGATARYVRLATDDLTQNFYAELETK